MSTIIKPRQTPTLRQLEEQGGPVEPYDPRFLRSIPTQDRARTTLKGIVDAAEKLLADTEVGRELITTALVAETSGVSIGLIYRYFEDNIAIMDFVWPQRRDTIMIRWTLEGATATAVEAPVVPEPA